MRVRKDDTAVPMSEATFTTKSGQTRNKKTTKGWKFCIQWNDGKCEWVKLKDLKESHPVEVAEYAKANQLLQEPAFCTTLKTRGFRVFKYIYYEIRTKVI